MAGVPIPVMRIIICSHPDHEGNREITDPYQQFYLRIDFVRLDQKERRACIAGGAYCRDCVDKIKRRGALPPDATPALF
jgi:hypothetical protein